MPEYADNTDSENIRIDLAFYQGKKGVLKLSSERLSFTPHKNGDPVSVDLTNIRKLNFRKTATVTSTLFVNEMEITVCRAHLWYNDIKTLMEGRNKTKETEGTLL